MSAPKLCCKFGTTFTSDCANNQNVITPNTHHHPKFNISEKSLLISAEAVGTVVLDYLKGDN
jgi:metal-dependent amidase/aminoacylase/carboxypeptidase family protein